ncbi:MAG: carbonic anhydrase [Gammaproteobacteria bacterium]
MEKSLNKILNGYQAFRAKYASGDNSVMQSLADRGQKPEVMVVSCCDSRVDPAVIFQCDPGDLFVVRNVANIVPPFEKDEAHHGISAALEFGIEFLKVRHLILLGHSCCSGIQMLFEGSSQPNDFIAKWVSLIEKKPQPKDADELARQALKQSYQHCLTFPWIHDRVQKTQLIIHLWFFDVKSGQIFAYSPKEDTYKNL